MKLHHWNCVTFFVLLVMLMPTRGARADFVYSFSATDTFTGATENFAFAEPSLITATGAFTAAFTIGDQTFVSGFFNASNDCFAFSTAAAPGGCSTSSPDSFYALFPGATTVGTFPESGGEGCAEPGIPGAHPCVFSSSLTISPSPEPSGIFLLGGGMLGLAVVLHRRRKRQSKRKEEAA